MPKFKPFYLKIFSSLVLISLFLGMLPSLTPSVAASQFSTGYDIVFNFSDNGQAKVTHNITLTNLTKDYYASEYSISTGSDKVTSVSGSDGLGALSVSSKTQDGSTVLIAKLNQQITGQGKSVTFHINYTIDGLASKKGRVWEVSVPQIVTNENLANYKLSLIAPKSFGSMGKLAPSPNETVDGGSSVSYIFTKNPNAAGIYGSFGDFQLYKFNLKYRYKNKNIYSAKATIALPPDTEYQAMNYQKISPTPNKLYTDSAGNSLADFTVKGNSELEINVTGVAKITDQESLYQQPKTWSQDELANFTTSDKYIEAGNGQIQKKAKELKDVKEIYDYVATTLKYDYSRLQSDSLGRRGALTTFNQPDKSICTDFSDLFVALARAKGIPARGLVGYAYTDNANLRPTKVEGLVDTTVLHAWPEYYDAEKKRWIQVDPTWGSTTGGLDYFSKLDTNHFVFVINGEDSEEPLPAGAYKTSSNQNDDVKVEFSTEEVSSSPDLVLSLTKNKVTAGFPNKTKLLIENKTGKAMFDATLTIKTSGQSLGLVSAETTNLGTILPFEKRFVDIRLRSDSLLDNHSENLQIEVLGKDVNKPATEKIAAAVIIKPFFSLEPQQIALLIVLLMAVGSFLYPYYYRSRHK